MTFKCCSTKEIGDERIHNHIKVVMFVRPNQEMALLFYKRFKNFYSWTQIPFSNLIHQKPISCRATRSGQ